MMNSRAILGGMPTDCTAPPLGPVVKSAVASATLVSLAHEESCSKGQGNWTDLVTF